MALSQEIKDYINSLLKEMDHIANGTRMPGSEIGENSMISGTNNAANAPYSAAIGSNNEVKLDANSAAALGDHSIAYSPYQLVHGKYNAIDANDNYAHIVGGGTDEFEGRKNIYTLDWDGNATFAGNVSIANNAQPVSDNDLVNLGYLNQRIAIEFFPHILSEDGESATVYVNDLQAYTIYKVKKEGQQTIKFAIKANNRESIFYIADLNINRQNMFVGEKTEESITFYIDSMIYTINLQTGKMVVQREEGDMDDESSEVPVSGGASIDDDKIDVNTTWSSSKISSFLDLMTQSIDKSFNKVMLVDEIGKEITSSEFYERAEYIIFCNDDEEIGRIDLPYAWKITEDHVKLWNRIYLKITAPNNGTPGQILSYVGLNEYNEVIAQWIDPPKVEIEDIGPIINDAADVKYYNGDITNVKQALDKLLYTAPSITIFNASPAPGTYEIGTVLGPISFTWETNKALSSQTLSEIPSLQPTDRSAIYDDTFKENKTFTLRIVEDASLGTGSASRSVSYTFQHRRYWGAMAEPDVYDSGLVAKLSNKEFATNNSKSAFTVTASADQYIYYCHPSSWGPPTFNVGGFDGGFRHIAQVSFTNTSGHTEQYTIWRSDNKGLGKQTITIK